MRVEAAMVESHMVLLEAEPVSPSKGVCVV